jgi:hypothetical protein
MEQKMKALYFSAPGIVFKNFEEFEEKCFRPLNSHSEGLGVEFFAY